MRFTRINLLASEEATYVLLDNSGPESSGPRRRALLKEAFDEIEDGVCTIWSPVIVIAKRQAK